MDEHVSEVDFKALLTEAHELGVQYTGDDGVELNAIVTMARAEAGRDHPVPCYGLSFEPTDRRCRICQLNGPCADKDKRPRIIVREAKLQAIPCGACGRGVLEVECVDEHGAIRDFACTTKGCQNSVAVQCGWESTSGEEIVREIVLGEAEEVKEEAPEPEAPEPEPAEEPAKPKPKLRVVKGGKAKKVVVKKTTKKTVVKKVAKKVAKKVTKKKTTKKATRRPRVSKSDLAFRRSDGTVYPSLTALVHATTGNKNWSPAKFFRNQETKLIGLGHKLTREWKGKLITVEVIPND